jgi:hypothetical protein
MKKFVLASMLILSGALLSACGGGSSSSTGTARIYLTDAPQCGYDHVYVTIDHIDLSSDNGTSWTSVPVDAFPNNPIDTSVGRRIDLLELQNGIMQQLAETPLAAGTYNQVRLVLQPNSNDSPWANAVVLTASPDNEVPLSTPSGQQSGYKIVGPFTVQPGTLADLNIDFNACKSVVAAGKSGKYNLKPVVRAVAEVVGSITGTTTAGAAVYAELNGQEITGTIADATSGNFTLYPLVNSTDGYDVVIVSPANDMHNTAIIQNVPVTVGAATSIGEVNPASTTFHTLSGTVTTPTGHDANMAVTQTLSASSSNLPYLPNRTYLIAMGPTDTTTGDYSFSLASEGPYVGIYSTTLPITLYGDTADAGIYTVTAMDADNNTGSQQVDVSGSDASGIDFSLSPSP